MFLVAISSGHIPWNPDAAPNTSSQSFPCAKALCQQEQLMTSMEKSRLLSKHKDLVIHQKWTAQIIRMALCFKYMNDFSQVKDLIPQGGGYKQVCISTGYCKSLYFTNLDLPYLATYFYAPITNLFITPAKLQPYVGWIPYSLIHLS